MHLAGEVADIDCIKYVFSFSNIFLSEIFNSFLDASGLVSGGHIEWKNAISLE